MLGLLRRRGGLREHWGRLRAGRRPCGDLTTFCMYSQIRILHVALVRNEFQSVEAFPRKTDHDRVIMGVDSHFYKGI
jgi:hypothetical protein